MNYRDKEGNPSLSSTFGTISNQLRGKTLCVAFCWVISNRREGVSPSHCPCWGWFEPTERVSPPCWVFGGILNREGETLLVVRVSNQLDVFCWAISVCPLSISFFFPANYNLRAKPWLYEGAGFATGFKL